MGFGVISPWIIVKAVDVDSNIWGEHGLQAIQGTKSVDKYHHSRGSRERRAQVRLTFPSQTEMGELGDANAKRVSRRAGWSEALDAAEKPRKAREGTLGLVRRGSLPQSNFRARWRQQTRWSGLKSQQEERDHVIISR